MSKLYILDATPFSIFIKPSTSIHLSYIICTRAWDTTHSIYTHDIYCTFVHVQVNCKCWLTGVSFVKVRNSTFPRHCRRIVVRLGSTKKPIPSDFINTYYTIMLPTLKVLFERERIREYERDRFSYWQEMKHYKL